MDRGPHITTETNFFSLRFFSRPPHFGDCGGDFFGAERSIVGSGGEGSREWWSGTRLQLSLVAVALSTAVAILAAATALVA
jgi:hypothetical protein